MDKLSVGSIMKIHQGTIVDSPVVQVIDIKEMKSAQAENRRRFRLIISDGVHFQQAMLATQLSDKVNDGSVQVNTVIMMKEYICNTVHSKRIIVIMQLQPTFSHPGRIGSPSNVEKSLQPQGQEKQPQPGSAAESSFGGAGNSGTIGQGREQAFNREGVSQKIGNYVLTPLDKVHQYLPSTWVCKGRVVQKTEIRTFKTQKGEGSLFNFNLIDSDGTEMRATAFGDACVNNYNLVRDGAIVLMKGASVRLANKRYNNLGTENELTVNNNTIIEEVEDNGQIQKISFNFKSIATLGAMDEFTSVDIIGVVTDFTELSTISRKDGGSVAKRSITLMDATSTAVEATIWGATAESFVSQKGDVVAIKGGLLRSYMGAKQVSISMNSTFISDPDVPEANQLKTWYESAGASTKPTLLAGTPIKKNELVTIGHINQALEMATIGHDGKSAYFDMNCWVTQLFHERDPWYNACPDCNRKMMQQDAIWYCEKCQKQSQVSVPTYILRFIAMDETGSIRLSSFRDDVEKLLGISAPELANMKEEDEASYNRVFSEARFKRFKITVRTTEYNEEITMQTVRLMDMDFVEESRSILKELEKYQSI